MSEYAQNPKRKQEDLQAMALLVEFLNSAPEGIELWDGELESIVQALAAAPQAWGQQLADLYNVVLYPLSAELNKLYGNQPSLLPEAVAEAARHLALSQTMLEVEHQDRQADVSELRRIVKAIFGPRKSS